MFPYTGPETYPESNASGARGEEALGRYPGRHTQPAAAAEPVGGWGLSVQGLFLRGHGRYLRSLAGIFLSDSASGA